MYKPNGEDPMSQEEELKWKAEIEERRAESERSKSLLSAAFYGILSRAETGASAADWGYERRAALGGVR